MTEITTPYLTSNPGDDGYIKGIDPNALTAFISVDNTARFICKQLGLSVDDWLYHANESDYGHDLRSAMPNSIDIYPGDTRLISTGIRIVGRSISGWAPQIIPRSGLGANKGIVVGNLMGLIDEGYEGEILVCVWNRNTAGSSDAFTVYPGDRIAQMIFVRCERPRIRIIDSIRTGSARSEGGFGSSGSS